MLALGQRLAPLIGRADRVATYVQELLEGLEPFVAEYLALWDGRVHRDVVFDLVALLKPRDYESEPTRASCAASTADLLYSTVLYAHILATLDTLATKADAEWQAAFVDCLRELVQNWAMRDDWGETER